MYLAKTKRRIMDEYRGLVKRWPEIMAKYNIKVHLILRGDTNDLEKLLGEKMSLVSYDANTQTCWPISRRIQVLTLIPKCTLSVITLRSSGVLISTKDV